MYFSSDNMLMQFNKKMLLFLSKIFIFKIKLINFQKKSKYLANFELQ